MQPTQLRFTDQTPFVPTPTDWTRWKGHKRKIFDFMQDGNWHSRDEIVEHVGTKQFTGRISELRAMGYVIECNRTSETGGTTYRIKEYVGTSTTNPNHCPTCSCK